MTWLFQLVHCAAALGETQPALQICSGFECRSRSGRAEPYKLFGEKRRGSMDPEVAEPPNDGYETPGFMTKLSARCTRV